MEKLLKEIVTWWNDLTPEEKVGHCLRTPFFLLLGLFGLVLLAAIAVATHWLILPAIAILFAFFFGNHILEEAKWKKRREERGTTYGTRF